MGCASLSMAAAMVGVTRVAWAALFLCGVLILSNSERTGKTTMAALSGKRIVMIIAPKNFRDEELLEPLEYLRAQGATVVVASTKKDPAKGMLGKIVRPDILIGEIGDVAAWDGVVFVGGSGADIYFQNAVAHSIARAAVEKGKVLGAICIAPATLANAGVLTGKKATAYSSVQTILRNGGAVVAAAQSVVRDGKIVTANGPAAATEFAHVLAGAF